MAGVLARSACAYDPRERVIDKLEEKGSQAVIPSTARRKRAKDYNRHFYKACHLIENFLVRLQQDRGGRRAPNAVLGTVRCLWHRATRYDKRAVNFFGAVYLAASVVWLN